MVNISQGSDETLVTVASSYKMQKTPWQLKQLPLQAPGSMLRAKRWTLQSFMAQCSSSSTLSARKWEMLIVFPCQWACYWIRGLSSGRLPCWEKYLPWALSQSHPHLPFKISPLNMLWGSMVLLVASWQMKDATAWQESFFLLLLVELLFPCQVWNMLALMCDFVKITFGPQLKKKRKWL